jgi:hypothetical protein
LEEARGSRWKTFVAVVTAVTGLIGAIVGIAQLSKDGDRPSGSPRSSEVATTATTSTGTSSTVRPTALSEWQRDVDAYCRELSTWLASNPQPAGDQANSVWFPSYIEQVSQFLKRVRSTPAPDENRVEIERFVTLFEQAVATGLNAQGAGQRGEQETYLALTRTASEQLVRADEIGTRLGLTC